MNQGDIKKRLESGAWVVGSLFETALESALVRPMQQQSLDPLKASGIGFYRTRYDVVRSVFENVAMLKDEKSIDGHLDYAFLWGNGAYIENACALGAALKFNTLLVLCEDGFLRSADTWANSKACDRYRHGCSLVCDTRAFYYDATKASSIELMLNDQTLVLTESQLAEARRLICRIVSNKLTKYNHQPIFKPEVGRRGKRKVLVVDQSYGDYAIRKGWADDSTFENMLATAVRENPDADILVKTHPDTLTGVKKGYYDGIAEHDNVFRVTMPINPYSLMDIVDKVYVCSTQLGFEALMAGKEVHVFGMPFYAGWGLTIDAQTNPRRSNRRTLEEVFYIFYVLYTKWINPDTNKRCTIDESIDYLIRLRDEYGKYAYGTSQSAPMRVTESACGGVRSRVAVRPGNPECQSPKVSVLLSVYNGEKYLSEALQSVLAQPEFTSLELVCTDDGSTDESLSILRKAAEADCRVRVMLQSNQGLGVARTRMLKAARGEYIMFLDADDKLASGAVLKRGYDQAAADDLDVLVSGGAIITENGELQGRAYIHSELIPRERVFPPSALGASLYLLSYPGVCGKLFRRSFVLDNGFQFPAVRRAEDFPFLEAALASAARIGVCDEVFFLRRIGTGLSIEEKKDTMPTAFFESEDILRKDMKRRGLWEKFAAAVSVASIVRLWYNFNSMRTYDGAKAVYDEMKRRALIEGFADLESSVRHDGYIASWRNIKALFEATDLCEYFFRRTKNEESGRSKLGMEVRSLRARSGKLEADLASRTKELGRALGMAGSCHLREQAIKASESYRIGMLLTWPARKVWRGFKCLRENGVKYTAMHSIGKALRLFGSKVKW